MTVKELIDELSKLPPDALVVSTLNDGATYYVTEEARAGVYSGSYRKFCREGASAEVEADRGGPPLGGWLPAVLIE